MQEQADKELFVKQLKEMLDWYTVQASDEEYDEESVKNILNLLDRLEPIAEEEIPRSDEAWERFKQRAEELPKRKLAVKSLSPRKALARFGGFVARHKCIAAAVLLLILLAVSGTAQAIATHGSDFFFWLKRDETGTQMMVSPEGLDDATEQKNIHYYESSEDLPDWAQVWFQAASNVEIPEEYEFQYFEVSEFEYLQGAVSHYSNQTKTSEMFVGVWKYFGKVSYNSEEFSGHTYEYSYNIDQKQIDVFSRTEENGDIYYAVCFYKNNGRYFIRGKEGLNTLKMLAEQYLECIQEL